MGDVTHHLATRSRHTHSLNMTRVTSLVGGWVVWWVIWWVGGWVCVRVCVCVCVRVRIYIYIYECIYMYIYIYIFVYVHMHMNSPGWRVGLIQRLRVSSRPRPRVWKRSQESLFDLFVETWMRCVIQHHFWFYIYKVCVCVFVYVCVFVCVCFCEWVGVCIYIEWACREEVE